MASIDRETIPWLLARFRDFERPEHAGARPGPALAIWCTGGSPARRAADSARSGPRPEGKSVVFRNCDFTLYIVFFTKHTIICSVLRYPVLEVFAAIAVAPDAASGHFAVNSEIAIQATSFSVCITVQPTDTLHSRIPRDDKRLAMRVLIASAHALSYPHLELTTKLERLILAQ